MKHINPRAEIRVHSTQRYQADLFGNCNHFEVFARQIKIKWTAVTEGCIKAGWLIRNDPITLLAFIVKS